MPTDSGPIASPAFREPQTPVFASAIPAAESPLPRILPFPDVTTAPRLAAPASISMTFCAVSAEALVTSPRVTSPAAEIRIAPPAETLAPESMPKAAARGVTGPFAEDIAPSTVAVDWTVSTRSAPPTLSDSASPTENVVTSTAPALVSEAEPPAEPDRNPPAPSVNENGVRNRARRNRRDADIPARRQGQAARDQGRIAGVDGPDVAGARFEASRRLPS